MAHVKELFSEFRNRKLYYYLLSFQILDQLINFIVIELARQKRIEIPMVVISLMHFTIILVLNLLSLVFVRRFARNKLYFYAFIFCFLASLVLVFYSHSPAGAALDKTFLQTIRFTGHFAQFLCLTFFLGILIRDIFQEKHDLTYSLTGATSIFLLFGTIFAFIFVLLELLLPGMFIPMEGSDILSTALTHSFYTLSGQESPVQNVNLVIKNLCIFESIFANLYAVMVVGRLLTK
jgi:hypothetical protein